MGKKIPNQQSLLALKIVSQKTQSDTSPTVNNSQQRFLRTGEENTTLQGKEACEDFRAYPFYFV